MLLFPSLQVFCIKMLSYFLPKLKEGEKKPLDSEIKDFIIDEKYLVLRR